MLRFVSIFALVAVATALPAGPARPAHPAPAPYRPAPAPYHPAPAHGPSYKEPQYEPRPYSYQYGVNDEYSGTNFNAQENSDGKAVTGSYQVYLPDGRVQTVSYTADHYNGYVADVQYEGTPTYPKYEPKPYEPAPHKSGYRPAAPSYKPTPSYKSAPTYRPAPSYRPSPSYKPTPSYN